MQLGDHQVVGNHTRIEEHEDDDNGHHDIASRQVFFGKGIGGDGGHDDVDKGAHNGDKYRVDGAPRQGVSGEDILVGIQAEGVKAADHAGAGEGTNHHKEEREDHDHCDKAHDGVVKNVKNAASHSLILYDRH